jgi:hypothetical protein
MVATSEPGVTEDRKAQRNGRWRPDVHLDLCYNSTRARARKGSVPKGFIRSGVCW